MDIHSHVDGKMQKAMAEHMKRMKPKGEMGMAQVERLGRDYKTGGFDRIAASASKEYGSKAAGERVAGAIFQKMARKHGG